MKPRQSTRVRSMRSFAVTALAMTGAAVTAQPDTTASQAPRAMPRDLIVPIHTQPADPEFGEYGTWAGGPGYKVRFGDDVAFFPRLGKHAPRNLPVRWTTLSVAAGADRLVDAATPVRRHVAGPRRFEYHRGPVVEAYDVRTDGLEQTFVLRAPPAGRADLVVEGRLDADRDLIAPAAAAVGSHRDLDFKDASGRTVVRYGRAFVLDATGRKQPIETEYDGTHTRLRVPRAFLDDAIYPVTVDPLTQPPTIINLDLYLQADVATQNETNGQTILVAQSLWTSQTDIDLLVHSFQDGWTGDAQLFADLSDGFHSNHPSVAWAGGANRWVVGFERQNTFSQIRLYLHDRDSTTFNSGRMVFLPRMTSTSHDWRCDVGGSFSTSNALVVCQSDFGATFGETAGSEVFGRVVNVATGALVSSPVPLGGSQSLFFDRDRPSVSAEKELGGYWMAAWSQRSILLGQWTPYGVYAARVSDNTASVVARQRVDDTGQSFDKIHPRIDGGRGEYLVTYTMAQNPAEDRGLSLHGSRFNNTTTTSFNDLRHRFLIVPPNFGRLVNTGLAFDALTRSHWALAYHTTPRNSGNPNNAWVARVGYNAGLTEQQLITGGIFGTHPVVGFNRSPQRFELVNNQVGPTGVFVRSFVYPPDAGAVVIGNGCGGTMSQTHPYAGNQNFRILLLQVPGNEAATLLLSPLAGNTPLDPFGFTGCTLHLDINALLPLGPVTTVPIFGAFIDLPLPESFMGDLNAQWFYTDAGAPGGGRVSQARRIQVR